MNQNELSISFTNNYIELEKYATKLVKQKQKQLDPSIILSELYLHLDKYKEEIIDDTTLIAYSKKFIKSNISWYNSTIYKESKREWNSEEISFSNETYCNNLVIDEDTIKDKFNAFYKTLNAYDKGLFHIYFINNKFDIKQIEDHLQISRSSAYRTLLECKELEAKFKQYIIKTNFL